MKWRRFETSYEGTKAFGFEPTPPPGQDCYFIVFRSQTYRRSAPIDTFAGPASQQIGWIFAKNEVHARFKYRNRLWDIYPDWIKLGHKGWAICLDNPAGKRILDTNILVHPKIQRLNRASIDSTFTR